MGVALLHTMIVERIEIHNAMLDGSLFIHAAAFINYNLRKEALAHCIRIGNCSAVVFSPSLSGALAEVLPELDPSLHDSCFSYGQQSALPQARNMEEEVKTASPDDPPPVEQKQATGEYTVSGLQFLETS